MPPRTSSASSDGQTSSKDGSAPSSKHEAQLADQLQGTVAETTEAPAQAVPAPSSSAADSGGVSVEDFLLPRTLTQRLAKGVLPPNTQIQRDAVLAITKAATVFVSYLSSHANEITLKKTLSPDDVLTAIAELEFDNFLPRLQRELAVHAEAAAGKRKAQRQRVKARESGGTGAGGEDGGTGNKNEEGDAEERDTKRLKRDEDNTAVISDGGGSGSGKEGKKKGSKVSEGKEADGEDDEEEGTEGQEEEDEQEEGDDVGEEEGDDNEESSEEEEEEDDEEREGDATDASHGHLQPDIDSELESASDKEGDPAEMDSQSP